MTESPLVSVLFITYKRLHLLETTLRSFLDHTSYPNLELVVSDDGSPASVQSAIQRLPFHRFVLSKSNKGTGANTNSGLRACNGEYILSLQDDWACRGPSDYLHNAVALLEARSDIGLVRFYGVDFPAGNLAQVAGTEPPAYRILPGASCERLDRPIYSDTPHLKSRRLIEIVGYYKEGCTMEDSELDYQHRVVRQEQLGVAFFPSYNNSIFVHIGEQESFRTTCIRNRLERLLVPCSTVLKNRSGWLYRASKYCYRTAVAKLVQRGLIR